MTLLRNQYGTIQYEAVHQFNIKSMIDYHIFVGMGRINRGVYVDERRGLFVLSLLLYHTYYDI